MVPTGTGALEESSAVVGIVLLFWQGGLGFCIDGAVAAHSRWKQQSSLHFTHVLHLN